MKAGAGKSEISLPEEYLKIEDFAVVHRTLNARAIVLESDSVMVFLSLELTSVPDEEAFEIRKMIGEKFHIEESHIWVCVTHTFSTPHFWSDSVLKEKSRIESKGEFRDELQKASLKAVEKAFSQLQPASIGIGTDYSLVNCNRDIRLEDGWWVGTNGAGLSDHQVNIIRIDNEKGIPLAVIFHYAIQSSVLQGSVLSAGGRAVTPDVAGIACDYIEKNMGNLELVALFLIGASGDQAPVEKAVSETFIRGERIWTDRKEEGFGICEKLGVSLGNTVCNRAGSIVCKEENNKIEFGNVEFLVPGKEMEPELKELHPSKYVEYKASQDKDTAVEVVCLGNIALVGIKPELNCGSGVTLQTLSPYPHTLVCTMINGSMKYMAEKASYDRFTYEAMNSPFGKGAAEILIEESLKLLKKMNI